MKLVNHLSVGVKIVAVVSIGLLTLIYISTASISRLQDLSETINNLTQKLAAEQSYAEEIHAGIHELNIDIDEYIAYSDQANLYHFDEVMSNIDNGLKNLFNISNNDTRINQVKEIETELEKLNTTFTDITEIIKNRQNIINKTLESAAESGNKNIEEISTQAVLLDESEAEVYCNNLANEFTNLQLITYKYIEGQNSSLTMDFETHYAAANSYLVQINSILSTEASAANAAEIQNALISYNEGFQQLVDSYQQQIILTDQEMNPSLDGLNSISEVMTTSVKKQFEDVAIETEEMVKNTELVIIIAFVVSVLFSLFIGYFLIRGIIRPLRQVENISMLISNDHLKLLENEMNLLAQGDLTRKLTFKAPEINIKNNDEIGRMAKSFNIMLGQLQNIGTAFDDMSQNLSELVGSVHLYAETIQQAAEDLAGTSNHAGESTSQIAITMQQVAEGINQQTESVTVTATSVENLSKSINGVSDGVLKQAHSIQEVNQLTQNMSQSIQQVSDNIRSVNTNAEQAAKKSQEGSGQVSETINDMEMIYNTVQTSSLKVKEMGEHSNQIEIILETIEDIASQTNLLALNAAIEAAPGR